jgi:hypothetical protein
MIVKIIILFVFVFALLSFNFLQINPNEPIKFKIYIFSGIFLFEAISDICMKLYKHQLIDVSQVIKNGLESGLVAIVAYGTYTDLVHMHNSWMENLDTPNKQNFLMCSLIVFAIALSYLANRVFAKMSPKINDCLNTIYPAK